jgi:hypothetical protein
MNSVLSLCDYLLGAIVELLSTSEWTLYWACVIIGWGAIVELLSTSEWSLYWACVIICWGMNAVLALNYYLPVNEPYTEAW